MQASSGMNCLGDTLPSYAGAQQQGNTVDYFCFGNQLYISPNRSNIIMLLRAAPSNTYTIPLFFPYKKMQLPLLQTTFTDVSTPIDSQRCLLHLFLFVAFVTSCLIRPIPRALQILTQPLQCHNIVVNVNCSVWVTST